LASHSDSFTCERLTGLTFKYTPNLAAAKIKTTRYSNSNITR
jgi:hypothetical protein